MTTRPTVYIVDDDAAVRDGLSLQLESADINVKAFASSAEFLASPPLTETTACLILDVRMPQMTGPELQAELATLKIDLPIIFLTGYGDIPLAVKTVKAGAFDFLTKPVDASKLLDKVEAALSLSARKKEQNCIVKDAYSRLQKLSKREHEVLMLALVGRSNKEIAQLLNISFRTVEHHRSHILLKTEVDNLLQLSHLVDICN